MTRYWENKMSKDEAISIVSQLIALAPVNLQTHQMGQQALQVLKGLEEPKKEEGKDWGPVA